MTIVLDNLPWALSEALAKRAQELGLPLREVVLEALRRNLEPLPPKRDLSKVVGTWVDDPEFDKAMEDFERVDEDLWK